MDGLNQLMDINVVEPVTIGAIATRLYFYYSCTHEVSGDLAEIRRALFGLHKVAILNHDELGQETLINMLLRNYLHYNLYDQAEKLRSKASVCIFAGGTQ
uniref:26S proteasome non-ATPase regulatory subunit 3 N-terminal TPR repeats domain-containing protein n=1 Tax=Populus trichocarpa TaxID=3694 RepID=A0A3N7FX35_POPTR